MKKIVLSESRVVDLLKSDVKSHGSRAKWRENHGISKTYLSDVLARRRPPGPKICDILGITVSRIYFQET